MSINRRPTLLPAGPTSYTTSPEHGSPSSLRSHHRRQMTVNACLGCRKKRTKCDGKTPCSRCIARNDQCDYKAKTSVTKHDLRAEVQTLRAERLNNRAVLHALLLDKHEAIVQRLRAGEPVDAIAQSLTIADDYDDDEDSEEGIKEEQTSSTLKSFPSAARASAVGADGVTGSGRALIDIAKQFEAGHVDPLVFRSGADITLPGWLMTPTDSSPALSRLSSFSQVASTRRHSFDATALTERLSVLGSSTWTKVTSNRALMNTLFGLFFSWEFPPFIMVSEELFLRDYFQGGRQFCSPALVNAVASVATRYMEPDETTTSGDAYLLGEQFFRESKGLLVLEAQIPNLPSIQTFALLAVREMSCGRELEAQELCLQAVRLLSALDFEALEAPRQLTDHLTVRSITFAGVLSLTRAIRLITDQLSPASNYHYSKMPLVSDVADRHGESLALQLEQRMRELSGKQPTQSKPKASDVLSNFIFDETESVYTFLSRTGGSGNLETAQQLPTVYRTCLQSYEKITDFLKRQLDSSPCALFAHIYFHFCLLALFRPFVRHGHDVAGISPRTVCAEAIQAILDLTQNYASLFTLRRTPCFIPYFVFAAGLTRIVLESETATDSSSASAMCSSPDTIGTETISPCQSSGALDEGGDTAMDGFDRGTASISPLSNATSMSLSMSPGRSMSTSTGTTSSVSEDDRGLTQAVLQLQEMSVGHPGAAQAGWVLRDFNPHQQDFR